MKFELGTIERHMGGKNVEPDDEALIFIDDDNDKTIHIRCPNAKQLAKDIIRAMKPHKRRKAPRKKVTPMHDGHLLQSMVNSAFGPQE